MVRAWIAFFIAMGLGCLSALSRDSVGFYAWIPAGLSLIVSVVLFIRERPLEYESFSEPVGEDPKKLYGNCGGIDYLKRTDRAAEPSAPSSAPSMS